MQRERIRDEAADWVVRLSDAPADGDRIAFEAWRTQDVEHDIAYERALAAWERLDRTSALGGGAVPDADLLAPMAHARKPAQVWSRLGAIAATLLLALGVGSTVLWSLTPSPAYATAVGERRTVRLPDGSTIEMNTDTQVIVRYRHGARAIELVRGEAMFHVVKDSRPFAITTASGGSKRRPPTSRCGLGTIAPTSRSRPGPRWWKTPTARRPAAARRLGPTPRRP